MSADRIYRREVHRLTAALAEAYEENGKLRSNAAKFETELGLLRCAVEDIPTPLYGLLPPEIREVFDPHRLPELLD